MFGEFENIQMYEGLRIPQTERYRKFLMPLDIDFTKIKTTLKWLIPNYSLARNNFQIF